MFKTKILIALLIFSSLQSCNTENTKWYKINKVTEPLKINKDKNWNCEVKNIANPAKLKIKDSLLYIQDSKSDKFIHVFNLDSNEKIVSIGIKGKGPGEILSPYGSLGIYNNKLWVFGATLNKYLGFNTDSILKKNYKPIQSELFFTSKSFFYEVGWLSNNVIVGLNFSEEEKRLTFYDINKKTEIHSGSIPPKLSQEIPTSIHKQSLMGTLKIKPDRSKIVIGSLYSDLIEIFDESGNDIIKTKTELDFLPKYELSDNNGHIVMGQGGDTRFGYIDVSVTNENIYALFSGNTRNDSSFAYGKLIHVFNWEGELIDVMELENDSISIEINSDNSELYVIEFTTIPKISKYTL
ncbi:BF3164 family lipoprotein [Flavivirga abyssicola]|uniref:BF3164 family lipoprotein n=1 Tax=Flavivirga abyssicola TaxID=3063533 RepID=UPI0026E10739|nr:BF3164 family lipoprotein [Flavivirga sp. MEBiC07777]WVK14189.1 BF3164 family lipoprotein [Flavivirga sp. MEBiC07777]